MDIGYLTGKPMELADPPLLFFILFVIDDFVWSWLRKKIGDLGFFFFFFCLLWTADGGCGGGGVSGGCGCG